MPNTPQKNPLPILDAVLAIGQPELLDELAAARALANARWGTEKPICPVCGCKGAELFLSASGVHRFICESENHDFNVFYGTALQWKTRVSARAMLFALREMASSHRSISARELARIVGVNHVTLWRHMHVLRSLLPAPVATPVDGAAAVQVCARSPRPRSGTVGASVVIGDRGALARDASEHHDAPRATTRKRLIGESIRTWLNGTFHGVTARHLPLYLREFAARRLPAFVIVAHVLNVLLVPTTYTVTAALLDDAAWPYIADYGSSTAVIKLA